MFVTLRSLRKDSQLVAPYPSHPPSHLLPKRRLLSFSLPLPPPPSHLSLSPPVASIDDTPVMLSFFGPRKLPPIPTGPQLPIAPDAEPKLTESPEELTPPKPLEAGNYPATPSLTSSGASVASTEQQATPPNTADNARPTAGGGADRTRKHPPEPTSPLRNSTPPTPNPIQRSGSAGPSTPEQQRTRPPRPPLPPVLGGDPNETQGSTQDGLSIISRTTYYTQRSAPGRARSRTTSAFLRDCHESWVYVLCSRPKILSSLLQYIDFAEFHALCCTSKPMRNILDVDLAVRDVILSRFVPGYRWGQAQLPMGHKDIRVDLRDLEALSEYMISPAPPSSSSPLGCFVIGIPTAIRLGHFLERLCLVMHAFPYGLDS